jgi:hypothetical protein
MIEVAEQWRQFLASRNDLVGGDLQHSEYPKGIFRGPIKPITIEGLDLVVVTHWMARKDINNQGQPIGASWKDVTSPEALCNRYSLNGVIMTPPRERILPNRVHFVSGLTVVTIFPKGGSKLYRKEVRNP